MPLSCIEATERYLENLRGNFTCLQTNSRLRIVTPYMYPDGDFIEVFIEEPLSGVIKVTDLGETLRHLESQGFGVTGTPKRQHMVWTIAEGMGVDVINGELVREGSLDELGELLFDVIVTARGVSDLVYTTRSYEPPTFVDEVGAFLQEHSIEYAPNFKLTGETGKIYTVNFRVIGTVDRYIHTLSPRNRGNLQSGVNRLFRMWFDCNGKIGRDAKISLLNDIDFRWDAPDIALLERVSVVGYWSERDSLVPLIRGRNGVNRLHFDS